VGTPESDPQVPDTSILHSINKRLRPPRPPIDVRPSDSSSGSAGPTSYETTRALERKVSRGPGIQALSAPGGKRVRVDRIGDAFRCDEGEIMEAARAARTSTGWERVVEVENYPSGLSAEDCGRILDRIRALEEKARDIVDETSALKTYLLH
jgi:hypothetical protein